MAMIYQVRELAKQGKGIGRFRYVGMSDEERGVVHECCQCENGHATKLEAEACPEAMSEYRRLFPCSHRYSNPDGAGDIKCTTCGELLLSRSATITGEQVRRLLDERGRTDLALCYRIVLEGLKTHPGLDSAARTIVAEALK